MKSYEYKVKRNKIEQKGQEILWKRELKELKKSYRKPKKHIQTTKIFAFLIILIIMANSIWIEWSALQLMKSSFNLEALSTLITIGIGSSFAMVLEFGIYCCKSYLESKEQERINLEREKIEINNSFDEDIVIGNIDENAVG